MDPILSQALDELCFFAEVDFTNTVSPSIKYIKKNAKPELEVRFGVLNTTGGFSSNIPFHLHEKMYKRMPHDSNTVSRCYWFKPLPIVETHDIFYDALIDGPPVRIRDRVSYDASGIMDAWNKQYHTDTADVLAASDSDMDDIDDGYAMTNKNSETKQKSNNTNSLQLNTDATNNIVLKKPVIVVEHTYKHKLQHVDCLLPELKYNKTNVEALSCYSDDMDCCDNITNLHDRLIVRMALALEQPIQTELLPKSVIPNMFRIKRTHSFEYYSRDMDESVWVYSFSWCWQGRTRSEAESKQFSASELPLCELEVECTNPSKYRQRYCQMHRYVAQSLLMKLLSLLVTSESELDKLMRELRCIK